MKTYKLFIKQYSPLKNDYVLYIKMVRTNDIYHEIGKLYCTEICDIKRIDYEEIIDKKYGPSIDKLFIEELNEVE